MRPLAFRVYWLVLFALVVGVFSLNSVLDISGLDTTAEVSRLTQQQGPEDFLVSELLADQRSWVKTRIEHGQCPETLILGSSTVGTLRPQWLSGRVLNGWLSGPTIEDFEAFTAILLRARCVPQNIVLGVDHWLLNSKVQDRRWLAIARDYAVYQRQYGSKLRVAEASLRRWDLFKERLTFVTTLTSLTRLQKLLKRGFGTPRPRLVHKSIEDVCNVITPDETHIRAFDGYYVQCSSFTDPPNVVEEVARNYVPRNGHQINEWTAIDADRLARLNHLLDLLHAHGAKIVLLAQPFHPTTYQAMRASPRIMDMFHAMDASLAQSAARLEGQYVNLRDPSIAGCSPLEFEDSHHAKAACAKKLATILDQALQPSPDRR